MSTDKRAEESPLEYAERIRRGIERKADKSRRWSTFLFALIGIATVFSPVLILSSEDLYLSKYFPAILTACAALASYWVQLRKPQERWVIYRTAQRELELEIDQYGHDTGEYAKTDSKDRLLVQNVSERALKLHYEWIPIVPTKEDLDKALAPEVTRYGI